MRTTSATIVFKGEVITVEADCTYEGCSASWGWDGGHPPEPPNFEFLSLQDDDGNVITLSDEDEDDLYREAFGPLCEAYFG